MGCNYLLIFLQQEELKQLEKEKRKLEMVSYVFSRFANHFLFEVLQIDIEI